MDCKFAVTVQHGGKHKSFSVSAGMTLRELKLLVKEDRYFNIPYCDDEEKIYLKLEGKELRNNDDTLAALGVYKNAELKLQWKNTRAGNQSQQRHSDQRTLVWKEVKRSKFTLTKKEIREKLSSIRRPPDAPDAEDPEGVLAGLTPNHFTWLEEAKDVFHVTCETEELVATAEASSSSTSRVKHAEKDAMIEKDTSSNQPVVSPETRKPSSTQELNDFYAGGADLAATIGWGEQIKKTSNNEEFKASINPYHWDLQANRQGSVDKMLYVKEYSISGWQWKKL